MEKKIWEINSLEEYKQLNPDMFKNHIAVFKPLGQILDTDNDNDCVLSFKRTDTIEGYFRFIYIWWYALHSALEQLKNIGVFK